MSLLFHGVIDKNGNLRRYRGTNNGLHKKLRANRLSINQRIESALHWANRKREDIDYNG